MCKQVDGLWVQMQSFTPELKLMMAGLECIQLEPSQIDEWSSARTHSPLMILIISTNFRSHPQTFRTSSFTHQLQITVPKLAFLLIRSLLFSFARPVLLHIQTELQFAFNNYCFTLNLDSHSIHSFLNLRNWLIRLFNPQKAVLGSKCTPKSMFFIFLSNHLTN